MAVACLRRQQVGHWVLWALWSHNLEQFVAVACHRGSCVGVAVVAARWVWLHYGSLHPATVQHLLLVWVNDCLCPAEVHSVKNQILSAQSRGDEFHTWTFLSTGDVVDSVAAVLPCDPLLPEDIPRPS